MQIFLTYSIFLFLDFYLVFEMGDLLLTHIPLSDGLLCLQYLSPSSLKFRDSTLLAGFVELCLVRRWRNNIRKRSKLALMAPLLPQTA